VFFYAFQLDRIYQGHLSKIKEHMVNLARNGHSMRDTGRVLKMRCTLVMHELKKLGGPTELERRSFWCLMVAHETARKVSGPEQPAGCAALTALEPVGGLA
jgi:hypothetical protein